MQKAPEKWNNSPRRSISRSRTALKYWGERRIKSAVNLTIFSLPDDDDGRTRNKISLSSLQLLFFSRCKKKNKKKFSKSWNFSMSALQDSSTSPPQKLHRAATRKEKKWLLSSEVPVARLQTRWEENKKTTTLLAAPALETLIALWLVRSAPFSFGNGTRQMSVQLVTVLDRLGILGSWHHPEHL